MLTFLDLFAGIGGFRLGMERAGHKCVGHCEYDKFANLSYKAMHNPKQMCGVLDSHVKTLALQGTNLDSKEIVQVYFSQLQNLLENSKKKIDPSTYLLRTLKIYLVLIEDLTSPNFSLSWMKSATMQNGKISILKTSEFPKTETEYTLLDILEEEVQEKYFLSQERVEKLLLNN
ncbi:C-5 cytosine-specific DNA methylase family protein [Clostridioides difficile DA00211]|nr:C-5 cytosine-specific DNA methylase family protein [Clostridioides difficile DA00211]